MDTPQSHAYHAPRPTLLETSRLCSEPGGLIKISNAIGLALAAARRDVELECQEIRDDDGTLWFDTDGGLFIGQDASDLEFRSMLHESIALLSEFGKLTRHAANPSLVRFQEEA